MDSYLKGSGLYLPKRVSDGISSCFVATKTNLIPSYSLTQAGGGMESIRLSQFFSKLHSSNLKEKGRKVIQK